MPNVSNKIWIKFNTDDTSTYPEYERLVIVRHYTGNVYLDKLLTVGTWTFAGCKTCITHWHLLPKFKE